MAPRASRIPTLLVDLLRRLARRGQATAPPAPPRRRLVLLQIDGLSSARLERAMADGTMPFLADRVASGRLTLRRLRTRTTPSTPVYQAGLLYGTTCAIPGFAWHDRRLGRTVRMDLAEDVEAMEGELEHAGGPGLLDGGASYGTIFSGSSIEAFFNVVRWGRDAALGPARRLPRNGWDAAATGILGAITLSRFAGRLAAELGVGVWDLYKFFRRQHTTRFEWRFLYMRLFVSVILRDIAAHGLILDVLHGVPVAFTDFLAYDEYAHRRGPDSPLALYNLRGIDEAIERVMGAVESVPEYGYEVYLVSDHGQSSSTPFERVVGEDPAEFIIRRALAHPDRGGSVDNDAIRELVKVRSMRVWARSQRRPLRTTALAYLDWLERRVEARVRERLGDRPLDVEVVTGGTIAHVYLARLDKPLELPAIERRFPLLVAALAACDGVGLLLARGADGQSPLVFYRGLRYSLDDREALSRLPPFHELGYDLLAHHLRTAASSTRSGDLVLYGAWAPAGNVAFDFEFGSHGGVHPEELDCFLLHPPGVDVPMGEKRGGWEQVSAVDLYRFFQHRLHEHERGREPRAA